MLPEACVANILSFTTPADTFSSAAVSSVFRVAGDSDFVWEKFLPTDYCHVISRSSGPHRSFSSKKELYRYLCESILIDNGRKVCDLYRCLCESILGFLYKNKKYYIHFRFSRSRSFQGKYRIFCQQEIFL